jgi:hypothetical protein
MSVQDQDVRGPLHAARLLRESEGYLKIKKLPKRADFDAKYEGGRSMRNLIICCVGRV